MIKKYSEEKRKAVIEARLTRRMKRSLRCMKRLFHLRQGYGGQGVP